MNAEFKPDFVKTIPWDASEHLKSAEDMAAYLEAALELGDPALVAAVGVTDELEVQGGLDLVEGVLALGLAGDLQGSGGAVLRKLHVAVERPGVVGVPDDVEFE